MNNFIKGTIEEALKSKKQRRHVYVKDVEKPTEEDVDEIVDADGNFATSKKPTDFNTKGITSNSTTDEVVKTGAGSMGIHGVHGTHTSLRYWAESDMSKSLGYEDTLGDDEGYKKAYHHFTTELGLSPEEAKERLKMMGYDEKLPDDKIRLIENPRKFIEEYIDDLMKKRTSSNDLLKKDQFEEKEINPIVLKQLQSLKNSMNSHDLSIEDIIKHLKDNE